MALFFNIKMSMLTKQMQNNILVCKKQLYSVHVSLAQFLNCCKLALTHWIRQLRSVMIILVLSDISAILKVSKLLLPCQKVRGFLLLQLLLRCYLDHVTHRNKELSMVILLHWHRFIFPPVGSRRNNIGNAVAVMGNRCQRMTSHKYISQDLSS